MPDARGTGLARKMIEKATLHARNWGCSILEISCRGGTHAEAAYLGLGFAEWGRLRGGYHDRGDRIFDEVRLWMPDPFGLDTTSITALEARSMPVEQFAIQ